MFRSPADLVRRAYKNPPKNDLLQHGTTALSGADAMLPRLVPHLAVRWQSQPVIVGVSFFDPSGHCTCIPCSRRQNQWLVCSKPAWEPGATVLAGIPMAQILGSSPGGWGSQLTKLGELTKPVGVSAPENGSNTRTTQISCRFSTCSCLLLVYACHFKSFCADVADVKVSECFRHFDRCSSELQEARLFRFASAYRSRSAFQLVARDGTPPRTPLSQLNFQSPGGGRNLG